VADNDAALGLARAERALAPFGGRRSGSGWPQLPSLLSIMIMDEHAVRIVTARE
jgi:hypothetical protein